MPKVSKESASQVQHVEGIIDDRSEELGAYTGGFTTFLADMDPAPLFRGLPDDRCQCPHWGYVLKGKITFRFADGEETYEAGDAYYARAKRVTSRSRSTCECRSRATATTRSFALPT